MRRLLLLGMLGVVLAGAGGVCAVAIAQTTETVTTTSTETRTSTETTTAPASTTLSTTTVLQTTTRRVVVPPPTTTGTTTSGSSTSSGTPTWVWVVLGILALAVIALVVVLLTRRGEKPLSELEQQQRLNDAVANWIAQGWSLLTETHDTAVLGRGDDRLRLTIDPGGRITVHP